MQISRKIWLTLAAGLFATIVGVIATIYIVYSSGSLVEARKYVSSSVEIRRKIGNIVESRPEVFKSSLAEGAATGKARLALKLKGSKLSAELFVTLEKVDGIWHVESAALDGVPMAVTRK